MNGKGRGIDAIEDGDLDEAVHEWMSERAAEVNNGGVQSQVGFLSKEGWTDERIVEAAGLPRAVRQWTLTTLREKLIKIGAKVVRHARQVGFQMAEVAVPRELFRAILEGMQRLRVPTPVPG